MAGNEMKMNRGRRVLTKIILHEGGNLFGVLVGHEPEREFPHGLAGQDGLGPLALVTAADAVDFGRRARPNAFHRRVAFLPAQGRRAGHLEQLGFLQRKMLPRLPFPRRERLHVLVKAVDLDLEILVVQARDQTREDGDRVFHCTAENARVQIVVGPGHGDLNRAQAAQAVGERRMPRCDHRRVGDDDDVAGQAVAVGVEEWREIRAADFLLALDEQDQVHRQVALFLQRVLDAEDVGEDLPFVIAGAPRGDDAVFDAGVERRPMPEIKRIDRLHVVMAVDQDRGPAFLFRPVRDDNGMSRRGILRGVESDRLQFGDKPLGAAEDLVLVFRIGRDTAEAEKIEKLVERGVGGHDEFPFLAASGEDSLPVAYGDPGNK